MLGQNVPIKVAGEMMKGISATEKTSEGLKINFSFL